MIRTTSLLLVCFLFACSNKVKVPKGILPPNQMQKVMWEMVKADEWINFQSTADSAFKRYSKSAVLYQTIFKNQHTTDSQFKTSFRYYQRHPDLMKIVLDSLQAESNRKQPILPKAKA